MTPDELVRLSLDLEAQFLEALGEDAKADAVRSREPAEPAPYPHPPFASPFHTVTALDEIPLLATGPRVWNVARREIEASSASLFTDHLGRIVPHFPSLIVYRTEESAASDHAHDD